MVWWLGPRHCSRKGSALIVKFQDIPPQSGLAAGRQWRRHSVPTSGLCSLFDWFTWITHFKKMTKLPHFIPITGATRSLLVFLALFMFCSFPLIFYFCFSIHFNCSFLSLHTSQPSFIQSPLDLRLLFHFRNERASRGYQLKLSKLDTLRLGTNFMSKLGVATQ